MYVPNEGIEFLGLNVIHLLDSIFDLLLVSTNVNNENQGLVAFDLLHCRLGGEWVLEDFGVVQLVPWSGTDAWVFGVSSLCQCLWPVECHLRPDLLRLLLNDFP